MKYNLRSLLLVVLACYLPCTKSQCTYDHNCDDGYYCNLEIYSCQQCLPCLNFRNQSLCAKNNFDQCGTATDCRDGYKFARPGECHPAPYATPFVLGTLAAIVLVVILITGAVHLWRRRKILHINPGYRDNQSPETPTAPMLDHTPPPPYYQEEMGLIECQKTELASALSTDQYPQPKFIESARDPGLQTEGHQRATPSNPPRYIRLPSPSLSLPIPHGETGTELTVSEMNSSQTIENTEQEPIEEEHTQFQAQSEPMTGTAQPQINAMQINLNFNNGNSLIFSNQL